MRKYAAFSLYLSAVIIAAYASHIIDISPYDTPLLTAAISTIQDCRYAAFRRLSLR